MSAAIAIFVKTPSLSPVKTRLAVTIGELRAEEFYILCLEAIENTVKNLGTKAYWAVGEKEGLSNPLWLKFDALYTGDGELGERQHNIYETLLTEYDEVLLIGSDAPQLSTSTLEMAMESLKLYDFVVGPACDGGYYLFGGKRSLPEDAWKDISWSTNFTREQLEKKLPTKPYHLPLLTDVDTAENLVSLCSEMPRHLTKQQQAIVEWVTFEKNSRI